MPRIRSIHPGLYTDEQYVSVSFAAREVWKGLWVHADDQGVFLWKPVTLKMQILPADNVDFPELLAELETAGLIQRFEVDDKVFGAVRNFQKWQNPKKPNAVYPLPDRMRCFVGAAHRVPNQCGTGSPPPPDGSEPEDDEAGPVPQMAELGALREEGEEGGRRVPPHSPPKGGRTGFDEFWNAYPVKQDRGHAERAWDQVVADTDPATILAGLERFRFGADPPKPQAWLRAKRWADQADDPPLPRVTSGPEPVAARVARAEQRPGGGTNKPSLVRILLANDFEALQAYEQLLRDPASKTEAGDGGAEVVRLRGVA